MEKYKKACAGWDKKYKELEKKYEELKGEHKAITSERDKYVRISNELGDDVEALEEQIVQIGEKFPVEGFTDSEKNTLVQGIRKLAREVKILDHKALKGWHNAMPDRQSKILFQLLKSIGKQPHDLARYAAVLCRMVVKVVGDIRTEDERKMRAKYWGKCRGVFVGGRKTSKRALS